MKIEYVSNDGIRFNSEEQCLKHEQTLKETLLKFTYFKVMYGFDSNDNEFDSFVSEEIARNFLNKEFFK